MAVKSIHEMRQPQGENALPARVWPLRGQTVMGLLFLVALLAFEIFNFDTTRFALTDFLGGASFAGLRWATAMSGSRGIHHFRREDSLFHTQAVTSVGLNFPSREGGLSVLPYRPASRRAACAAQKRKLHVSAPRKPTFPRAAA